MKKIVAVIYGGRSAEHEVSLVSGRSVAGNLDREKFDVLEIMIEKNGDWKVEGNKVTVEETLEKVDIAFPVLHGTYGEDGKIQGLFEMLDIPFVGCGVAESALGMDKEFSKIVWAHYGLPVVKFTAFTKVVWQKQNNEIREEIEVLKLPFFVKPANLGSSVGITKVKTKTGLEAAIDLAFNYGEKIIIEEAVEKAREIELSVLGNERIEVSVCGEIVPDREFYDYDSKYDEKSTSKPLIPAPITEKLSENIRHTAQEAYRELGLNGYARVDFLLGPSNNFFVSEVNTIPGFTPISMFPKLWEASGLKYNDLLTRLVDLAIEKYNEKASYKL
jgi:D-alanine-D-alanine ligase